LRSKLMPYHLEALETDWEDLSQNYQVMLKALLNGGGYFALSVGLSMAIILLIPFRNSEAWAGYAVGVIGLVGAAPLGLIVRTVKTKTKGNPPFALLLLPILLLIIGLMAFSIEQILASQ